MSHRTFLGSVSISNMRSVISDNFTVEFFRSALCEKFMTVCPYLNRFPLNLDTFSLVKVREVNKIQVSVSQLGLYIIGLNIFHSNPYIEIVGFLSFFILPFMNTNKS